MKTTHSSITLLAPAISTLVFKKSNALTPEEFAHLENSDPAGVYEQIEREALYVIINKLTQFKKQCTLQERWLLRRHLHANFGLRINERSRAEGALRFAGTVVIEGKLLGECRIRDTLVVEYGARVVGEVTAGEIICKGEIVGNVHARNRVEIHEKGRLYGDIHTPSLQVSVGGLYEGRCVMNPDPAWFKDIVFGRLEKSPQVG